MKNKLIPLALLMSSLMYCGCDLANWLFPDQPPCPDTFSLHVAVLPAGAGNFTVTPELAFYEYGAVVDVSISANTHYRFDHWEGDLSGASAVTSISMTGPKSLVAVFTVANGYCGIAGTVMDSAGGAPVEGATVGISTTGLTTTTDTTGTFNLISDSDTLIPGTYDILVTKTGMAASKLQAVEIKSDEVTSLDIIQTTYSIDTDAVVPPTIGVTGITKGSTYSSYTNISITVTAGSCPVQASGEHDSVYLKIGSLSGYYETATSQTSTLTHNWYPSSYPPGDLNIKILAYDTNNNRSELNIPVIVSTSSSARTPFIKPGPCHYVVNAYSFGKSQQLFNIQQSVFGTSTSMQPVRSSASGVSPSSLTSMTYNGAPAGCSAYVNIFLLKINNMLADFAGFISDGLAVYHAPSPAGPYTLAGKTTKAYYDERAEAELFQFRDYSPLVSPGKTVWYKVAWYNTGGEGPLSEPIEVPVLPVYSLQLTSPVNNSVITDSTPLLQWSSTAVEKATRYDELVLKDVLTDELILGTVYTNTSQAECPTLHYGVLYKWNVSSCYELITDQCYSFALLSDSSYANNGWFYFTVNPQEVRR